MQRQKEDAETYIATNSLNATATRDGVRAYANDGSNPAHHRTGLVNAWNLNHGERWNISMPAISASATAATTHPGSYHSDSESEMEDEEYDDMRSICSQDAKQEIKSTVNADQYRLNTVRVTFGGSGYGFTSSQSSNLISGKGYSTVQSDYDNVLLDLANVVGGHQALARVIYKGLYDTAAFQTAISAYGEKEKNKLHFLVSLFQNEVIGRSTSNLLEITAILDKTSRNGGNLWSRFEKYGVFIPTAKQNGGIGGQKLSRIGHGDLDRDDLNKHLTEVLGNNNRLYRSLMKQSGVKDVSEFAEWVKTNVTSPYAKNLGTHLTYVTK